MNIKFGICADIHTEFIHNADERMKDFLEDCEKNNVDFCIQLGDFCPPGEMNRQHKEIILKMLDDYTIPFYHSLGNHDMDENSKEDVLAYLKSDLAYYSFDAGGIHFVVLDTCYYKAEDNYYSYDYGNYKSASEGSAISVLPPKELEWLKKDLSGSQYPAVIFSHHSLIESRSGICNPEEFRAVVKEAGCPVIMAICGHEHVDRMEQRDGICYWCVNSMSYYWAGEKYAHKSYPDEIHRINPLLQFVFPYEDALYAIVEINDNGIYINGTKSEIRGVAPDKMKFVKPGLVDSITASVAIRTIHFNK